MLTLPNVPSPLAFSASQIMSAVSAIFVLVCIHKQNDQRNWSLDGILVLCHPRHLRHLLPPVI